MDFAALALGIYTVLSPLISKGINKFVEKAGEKVGEKAAEEGWTERKAIWDKVKGLFVEDELTLLNLFQESETDAEKKGELKGELKLLLKSNPDIAKELEALVNTIKEIEKRNKSKNTVEGVSENSEVSIKAKQSTANSDENDSENIVKDIKGSKIIIETDQS